MRTGAGSLPGLSQFGIHLTRLPVGLYQLAPLPQADEPFQVVRKVYNRRFMLTKRVTATSDKRNVIDKDPRFQLVREGRGLPANQYLCFFAAGDDQGEELIGVLQGYISGTVATKAAGLGR